MGMCALHSAKRNLGTVQTGVNLSRLLERRDLGGAQGVLAQREMEKKRSRLVVDSAPAGRGFSRHSGLSSDDSSAGVRTARESRARSAFPKQENFSFRVHRAVSAEKIAPGWLIGNGCQLG